MYLNAHYKLDDYKKIRNAKPLVRTIITEIRHNLHSLSPDSVDDRPLDSFLQ